MTRAEKLYRLCQRQEATHLRYESDHGEPLRKGSAHWKARKEFWLGQRLDELVDEINAD